MSICLDVRSSVRVLCVLNASSFPVLFIFAKRLFLEQLVLLSLFQLEMLRLLRVNETTTEARSRNKHSWSVSEDSIDLLNRLQLRDPALARVGPTATQIRALDVSNQKIPPLAPFTGGFVCQGTGNSSSSNPVPAHHRSEWRCSKASPDKAPLNRRRKWRNNENSTKHPSSDGHIEQQPRKVSENKSYKSGSKRAKKTTKKSPAANNRNNKDQETTGAVKHSLGPGGDSRGSDPGSKPTEEFRVAADPSGGGEVIVKEQKGHVDCKVVYSREFLIQCAENPHSWLSPSSMVHVSLQLPGILRKIPGRFRGKVYKKFCDQLKSNV